jgi:hypothetical protein
MSDEEQPVLTPARDTITVVQTVYHQPAGEEPTAVTLQYVRPLETSEQPYVRKIKVGESWQPLDLGWIEQPGMILLVNDEGKFTQTIPTPEERAEAEAKVVEVGLGSPPWLIPPQGSFLGMSSGIGRRLVNLRCQKGTARVTIHVYPR